MKIKQLITLTIVLSVAALARTAGDARTGYDHRANFAGYKTYSWSTLQTGDSISDQRVKAAVDAELTERGWNLISFGGDVTVAAMATASDHPTQRYFNDLGGSRSQGFPYPLQYDYRVQTLAVNLIDAGSGQLIWHGSASAILSDTPAKNAVRLAKGVREMFGHFPRTSR